MSRYSKADASFWRDMLKGEISESIEEEKAEPSLNSIHSSMHDSK